MNGKKINRSIQDPEQNDLTQNRTGLGAANPTKEPPRALLAKSGKTLDLDPSLSLMANLLARGVPVASSCGGDGICGKCRVQVLEGEALLSPAGSQELALATKLKLESTERLSCQVHCLQGTVKIDTSYW